MVTTINQVTPTIQGRRYNYIVIPTPSNILTMSTIRAVHTHSLKQFNSSTPLAIYIQGLYYMQASPIQPSMSWTATASLHGGGAPSASRSEDSVSRSWDAGERQRMLSRIVLTPAS
jgi:hypothetical protein